MNLNRNTFIFSVPILSFYQNFNLCSFLELGCRIPILVDCKTKFAFPNENIFSILRVKQYPAVQSLFKFSAVLDMAFIILWNILIRCSDLHLKCTAAEPCFSNEGVKKHTSLYESFSLPTFGNLKLENSRTQK